MVLISLLKKENYPSFFNWGKEAEKDVNWHFEKLKKFRANEDLLISIRYV